MSKSLDLLSLPPEAGLREIIQTCLEPGVSADIFRIGKPTGEVDGETTVELKIDRLNVPVDLWIYKDALMFRYKRYHLQTVMSAINAEAIVDFPVTEKEIAAALTHRYGIVFDDKDLRPVSVDYANRDSFVLQAGLDSLRWVGQTPLRLKQRVLTLTEAFINRELEVFETPRVGDIATLMVEDLNRLNAGRLYRPIRMTEVSFGLPTLVHRSDISGNTRITMRAHTSDLYKGELELTYRRYHLPTLVGQNFPQVRSMFISEHWEAAVLAGQQLGITITEDDVVPGVLPAPPEGQVVPITIEIKPTSRGFVGPLHIEFVRAWQ